jgi:hypothetical protein
MSEKYRATDKDWELVEEWAPDDTDVRCLLELRSRVELLEATQHAHLDGSQMSEADREAMKEPGKVVTGQPEPAPLATDQDLYQLYDLTGPTVVDAFRAIYDFGRQHGARAAATEADNATAATVAEIRSSLFNTPAQPAPAGGLVERLAWIIEPDDPLVWRGTCGLILREVAAWLREREGRHTHSSVVIAGDLEQEASR